IPSTGSSNMSMIPSTGSSNMSMIPSTGSSNFTVDLAGTGSSKDSSSPQSDLSNIEFSKSTTIQDIINIHNTGVPFDKLIKKVASDARSPQSSIGQASAWDAIEYSLSGNINLCTAKEEDDSIMDMLDMDKSGYCNILVSFTYETCKALPTNSDCVQDKEEMDSYVATNNLAGKTNDYAYEFLEIMSSRLNQAFSNSIDEMIYFSGDHDRNAVAYIEGRLKVMVG
ncbi:MAG: hypothetical protein L0H53_13170, partial [Candidatus Nitrosocosmicus sp.]|nr:hypothetical protein [Candidatus Nitrosocosmicus sp.]